MIEPALLEQIRQLSVTDRIDLVGTIWDSIAAEPGSLPLTPAQAQELQRRQQRHRDHPEAGVTWEELERQLLESESE